jgi:L,D-transpeptidase YcbB
MSKNYLLILITAFLFISCNTKQKPAEAGHSQKPDLSVSKTNAYNNIFFDSSKLSAFCQSNNIDATLVAEINNFYFSRNFQFAWFNSNGLNEQARSLWNLLTYSKTLTKDTSLYNKTLKTKMQNLIVADSLTVINTDDGILKTEFLLTRYFINYLDESKIETNAMQTDLFIPSKKSTVSDKAKALLAVKMENDDNDVKAYNALLLQLKKYDAIANKGWQQIPFTQKKLVQGKLYQIIPLIKQRLAATADLQSSDTSHLFDTSLEKAIKNYQMSLGYTPNGNITDSLIKDMNVSCNKRVQQILVNLNRMRWMPREDSGKLIVCNIPEYKIHVYESGKEVFEMNTIVGKDGHSTVIFTGNLDEIVFSPYWNLPISIVKNEILQKMKDDKHYLKKNNMEITGNDDGIPVIRQLPGEKNSLGKVKFLFPNDFNIYFHDTPEKSLFDKDKRAYSHGCIRLSDPLKMAEYLLKDMKEWSTDKIIKAMNEKKETHVELKKSVPVLITYYTAWVDGAGRLNFRDDIYGHDSTIAANMFTDPQ